MLDKRGISVEKFSYEVGVSKQSLYFYLEDISRPTEQTMARICKAVGRPLQEGLAQYTPKVNGRPKGTAGPKELSIRQR